MVMDRPLSPQSVGREFVRQYYTLLNEAPDHLHRFYNNSSSFVHGGLGASNRDMPTVVGQKQIHQQIQQLNFRDCHAKINQVDSQATLDNGVVVQVSGELSNAGLPMRRFTQTFVLAAQSPKKYYVHNDIFRYQDLLPEEELEMESSRSEAEEDHEASHGSSLSALKTTVPTGYYTGQVNGLSDGSKSHEEITIADHHQQLTAPPPQQQQPTSAPVPVQPSFSSIDLIQPVSVQPLHQHHVESLPEVPQQQQELQASYLSSVEQQHQQEQQQQLEPAVAPPSAVEPSPLPSVEYIPSAPQPQPAQSHHISPNEPKTYANLVKKGHAPISYPTSPFQQAPSVPSHHQAAEPTSPPALSKTESKGFDSRPMLSNGPKPQRNEVQQRNSYNSLPRQQNYEDTNGNGYGDDRRRAQYSDSQQVFIGNIPHNATDMELKDLFGQFGAIVDFKLLSKSGNKGPAGTKLPYYGFITFEEVSSVQAVLNAKSIMFPDENGVKLNVEEKKARKMEGGGGGPRGGGRGGGMMGGGGGGRIGGGGGGASMPRGGGRGGGVQRSFNNGPLPARR